jgi:hypothetical protein
MPRARRRSLFVGVAVVCLSLYAGVMLASPGLHHDFDCHLKSPRHCQACTANPLCPRAEPGSETYVTTLLEAGAPVGAPQVSIEVASVPRVSGRAPPLSPDHSLL